MLVVMANARRREGAALTNKTWPDQAIVQAALIFLKKTKVRQWKPSVYIMFLVTQGSSTVEDSEKYYGCSDAWDSIFEWGQLEQQVVVIALGWVHNIYPQSKLRRSFLPCKRRSETKLRPQSVYHKQGSSWSIACIQTGLKKHRLKYERYSRSI